MILRFEVASKDSPAGRRTGWITTGATLAAFGLFLILATSTGVSPWGGTSVGFILVVPGILYLTTGVAMILRVAGVATRLRVRFLCLAAFAMSTSLATTGAVLSCVWQAFSTSTWQSESGSAGSAPDGPALLLGVCVAVTLISAFLTLASLLIRDEAGTR